MLHIHDLLDSSQGLLAFAFQMETEAQNRDLSTDPHMSGLNSKLLCSSGPPGTRDSLGSPVGPSTHQMPSSGTQAEEEHGPNLSLPAGRPAGHWALSLSKFRRETKAGSAGETRARAPPACCPCLPACSPCAALEAGGASRRLSSHSCANWVSLRPGREEPAPAQANPAAKDEG